MWRHEHSEILTYRPEDQIKSGIAVASRHHRVGCVGLYMVESNCHDVHPEPVIVTTYEKGSASLKPDLIYKTQKIVLKTKDTNKMSLTC